MCAYRARAGERTRALERARHGSLLFPIARRPPPLPPLHAHPNLAPDHPIARDRRPKLGARRRRRRPIPTTAASVSRARDEETWPDRRRRRPAPHCVGDGHGGSGGARLRPAAAIRRAHLSASRSPKRTYTRAPVRLCSRTEVRADCGSARTGAPAVFIVVARGKGAATTRRAATRCRLCSGGCLPEALADRLTGWPTDWLTDSLLACLLASLRVKARVRAVPCRGRTAVRNVYCGEALN